MSKLEVLYKPYTLGKIELKNRFVMAPMTRSRALDYMPNDLMVEYYKQRSSAGLVITEGVAPSVNGTGYIRIPGIYSQAQIEGWKKITTAVHAEGAKIFMQLMHTGRVAHVDNLPEGGEIVAPSAITLENDVFTDTKGPQPASPPRAMTIADIEQAKNEFAQAASNAIEAGFDGIELHGAAGYLIDEFLNPGSNRRTDNYGGSIENRTRFAIEVAEAVAKAIGPEKVGFRITPYGNLNGMIIYQEMEETFFHLADELDKLGILYIHFADHSSLGLGIPPLTESITKGIRNKFKGTIIGVRNHTAETAISDIENGVIDLPAFGRAFLSNPDLPYRIQNDSPLNQVDYATMYSGQSNGEGYTDYPFASK